MYIVLDFPRFSIKDWLKRIYILRLVVGLDGYFEVENILVVDLIKE